MRENSSRFKDLFIAIDEIAREELGARTHVVLTGSTRQGFFVKAGDMDVAISSLDVTFLKRRGVQFSELLKCQRRDMRKVADVVSSEKLSLPILTLLHKGIAENLVERVGRLASFRPQLLNVELVNASVPIVKIAMETQTGIANVDICVDLRCQSLFNTRLVRAYAVANGAFADLTILIKMWCSKFRISQAKDGFFSGYQWTLLVIYYLQHCVYEEDHRAVLPNLQNMRGNATTIHPFVPEHDEEVCAELAYSQRFFDPMHGVHNPRVDGILGNQRLVCDAGNSGGESDDGVWTGCGDNGEAGGDDSRNHVSRTAGGRGSRDGVGDKTTRGNAKAGSKGSRSLGRASKHGKKQKNRRRNAGSSDLSSSHSSVSCDDDSDASSHGCFPASPGRADASKVFSATGSTVAPAVESSHSAEEVHDLASQPEAPQQVIGLSPSALGAADSPFRTASANRKNARPPRRERRGKKNEFLAAAMGGERDWPFGVQVDSRPCSVVPGYPSLAPAETFVEAGGDPAGHNRFVDGVAGGDGAVVGVDGGGGRRRARRRKAARAPAERGERVHTGGGAEENEVGPTVPAAVSGGGKKPRNRKRQKGRKGSQEVPDEAVNSSAPPPMYPGGGLDDLGNNMWVSESDKGQFKGRGGCDIQGLTTTADDCVNADLNEETGEVEVEGKRKNRASFRGSRGKGKSGKLDVWEGAPESLSKVWDTEPAFEDLRFKADEGRSADASKHVDAELAGGGGYAQTVADLCSVGVAHINGKVCNRNPAALLHLSSPICGNAQQTDSRKAKPTRKEEGLRGEEQKQPRGDWDGAQGRCVDRVNDGLRSPRNNHQVYQKKLSCAERVAVLSGGACEYDDDKGGNESSNKRRSQSNEGELADALHQIPYPEEENLSASSYFDTASRSVAAVSPATTLDPQKTGRCESRFLFDRKHGATFMVKRDLLSLLTGFFEFYSWRFDYLAHVRAHVLLYVFTASFRNMPAWGSVFGFIGCFTRQQQYVWLHAASSCNIFDLQVRDCCSIHFQGGS
eukprot:GHVU01011073.1.p1 GENE.GHVU01011073.1~~GHVU01011073.1.p1  ORF type:complete len:1023 (-),score=152.50 GHVU01011073.1:243-3311(-)